MHMAKEAGKMGAETDYKVLCGSFVSCRSVQFERRMLIAKMQRSHRRGHNIKSNDLSFAISRWRFLGKDRSRKADSSRVDDEFCAL
jgi:hypothetical protein